MSFVAKESKTKKELEVIIALRYKILRKPWDKPLESASDQLEESSINAYIADEKGNAIACGRLQENENLVGQIRYMAVDDTYQGKGLGKLLLKFLEGKGKELGLEKIELHARENALRFYEASGYKHKELSYKLWDIIQHYLMEKRL